MGIELQYYADKEDAYKMKYFFDKNSIEKNTAIKLTDDIAWNDISNCLEEVDINGEEKNNKNFEGENNDINDDNVNLNKESNENSTNNKHKNKKRK